MNAGTFDRFSQSLVTRQSRRAAIAALAAIFGISTLRNAEAKKKRRRKHKQKCKCGARVCGQKVCKKKKVFCGECPVGQTCSTSGQCEDDGCTPSCQNKACGADDGCGGTCDGTCTNGQVCQNGRCEDGTCPADATYCRREGKTACGDSNCACGSGTCADCAAFLSPDPVTDDACASVGLPPGTVVGDGTGENCQGHAKVCLTPCGSCTNCACIPSTQAQRIHAEGGPRIVGFKPVGGKKHRKN